jgi:hypothetical protein
VNEIPFGGLDVGKIKDYDIVHPPTLVQTWIERVLAVIVLVYVNRGESSAAIRDIERL